MLAVLTFKLDDAPLEELTWDTTSTNWDRYFRILGGYEWKPDKRKWDAFAIEDEVKSFETQLQYAYAMSTKRSVSGFKI